MKVRICDICGEVQADNRYKFYKGKKYGPERGWRKIDICSKCINVIRGVRIDEDIRRLNNDKI